MLDHYNISRLEEKESDLDEKLLKAYMDYADKLLDEEEYQMVKEKLTRDREAIYTKKEVLENKLGDMKKAVSKFHGLAERLERFWDIQEFDEELVKDLVDKIYVSDNGNVEIMFSCCDVFQNTLIDEFLGNIGWEGCERRDEYCYLSEAI